MSWLAATAALAQSPVVLPPGDNQPQIIRIAFSAPVLRNANVNDAAAAYRLLFEQEASRYGYRVTTEVEIINSLAGIETTVARTENPAHLIILTGHDFLEADLPPQIEPRWFVGHGAQSGRSYLVLTRRSRNVTQLADLRGQSLNWLDSFNTEITRTWLETVLREQNLPPPAKFFGEVTMQPKPTATILPVFFGRVAACLVDEPSFRLTTELNPQVARELVVLMATDLIVDPIICVRSDGWGNPAFQADMMEAVATLHERTTGRQILDLFGVSRMYPFEPALLDSTRALRERHRRAFSADSIPAP